ncbi:uncharacterized protein MYCGRDRAFT_91804 [Zymoseptoria tritici IPO323]|uniref:Uncharacterized protein n=1 Tax=Zymoseptoria tritici (strain CBS 115943 / IPO323) TaxID=336722 RepID=F9X6B6_ZYMTI|nr:uncharacterized protein MYCGRDRAFT_91804 [Zymoseptoria tritici IPO323]EGP88867.1 hypothetical protein MYCGRDRAFT_91804 [Zymoseptoria tritici IPO323]
MRCFYERHYSDDDEDSSFDAYGLPREDGETASSSGSEPQSQQRGKIEKLPLPDEICNAIDGICEATWSKWAASGPLTGPFADPQLSIDDSGPIRLPLSETVRTSGSRPDYGPSKQTFPEGMLLISQCRSPYPAMLALLH